MFLKKIKKCNKDRSWPPPKCKKCYTFFLKASLRNPLKNPSDPNVFPHSCGQLNSLRSFCSFVLVLFVLNNVRHPSSSKFSSFLLNSGMFRYFQKCKKTTSEAEWSVPACLRLAVHSQTKPNQRDHVISVRHREIFSPTDIFQFLSWRQLMINRTLNT